MSNFFLQGGLNACLLSSYAVRHKTKMFGDQSFIIKVSHDCWPHSSTSDTIAAPTNGTSPGSWEGEMGRPASNIKNSHNLPLPTTDWRPNCPPVRDIKHFLRRKFLFRAQLQSFLSLSCELAGFVISYDKEKLRSNRIFVAAVKRLARNVGTFPRGRR